MSLSEAVLAVVEEMEKDAGSPAGPDFDSRLYMYAKQLRIALKASAGAPGPAAPTYRPIPGPQNSDNNPFIREAREEFRKAKKEAALEPGSQILLTGFPGDNENTRIIVEDSLTVGAMPVLDNKVWRYEADGKLHYMAEETEKYLKATGKQ